MTAEAKQWAGWGTALKPAVECWWLVRKPLSERTVSANVLKWGTGGLNIDGCRIGTEDLSRQWDREWKQDNTFGNGKRASQGKTVPPGRFPANLLLDETAAAMLDEQSGERASGAWPAKRSGLGYHGGNGTEDGKRREANSGGASRFFYVAKASRRERGTENAHPTVKPIALMRYLCRLVTPPGGVVLDPFTGSGTTGVAARREGFRFVGIERQRDYVAIARRRIKAAR